MSKKTIFLYPVSCCAGLFMIAVLFRRADFETLFDDLLTVSLPMIGLAIIPYALSWWGRANRLSSLFTSAGITLPLKQAFITHITGQALNNFLPANLGDGASILLLKKGNIPLSLSTATLIHMRLLDFLVLGFFLSFACRKTTPYRSNPFP